MRTPEPGTGGAGLDTEIFIEGAISIAKGGAAAPVDLQAEPSVRLANEFAPTEFCPPFYLYGQI